MGISCSTTCSKDIFRLCVFCIFGTCSSFSGLFSSSLIVEELLVDAAGLFFPAANGVLKESVSFVSSFKERFSFCFGVFPFVSIFSWILGNFG